MNQNNSAYFSKIIIKKIDSSSSKNIYDHQK
jgi:hypothetical protein